MNKMLTSIIEWKKDILIGDLDINNIQLRPHIVWFGEEVPEMERAMTEIEEADYVVVIGTSLQVYPAAGLINYVSEDVLVYYIDPKPATIYDLDNPIKVIPLSATEGMKIVREELKRLK